MFWQRVSAISLRYFFLLRGSWSRIFPIFAWVAIDMVLWGFIARYFDSLSQPGHKLLPALLGAVLFWDFFTRVMQGVTTGFLEDVWARNFLNLFATPISVPEYLTGLTGSSFATSLLGLGVMLLLAAGFFGLDFGGLGLALLPFLLILFAFGIALGILACAVVLRWGPSAEWFVWPIPALLAPFSGVFYPLSTLPQAMQWIGRLLPPTYVFEGLRAILSGNRGAGTGLLLAIGAGLALADILLAAWIFTRVFRMAIRTGLVARYSAESLA